MRLRKAERERVETAVRGAAAGLMRQMGREDARVVGDALAVGVSPPRRCARQALELVAMVSDAARQGEINRIKIDRAASKQPRLRKVDLTLPGGEAPTVEALSHHAVVALPVQDRNRPRPLVLSGALPPAVGAMVKRGELAADHAKALADYADDCRLAEQDHLRSGELRERVQGGKGPVAGGGVTPVVLDARSRVREARKALTPRIASIVESVMIREVSFSIAGNDMFPNGQRTRSAGAVAGLIIGAAAVLHSLRAS